MSIVPTSDTQFTVEALKISSRDDDGVEVRCSNVYDLIDLFEWLCS